jgi:hypothetical protein
MTPRNLKEELTLTGNGFLFDHVTGLTYTLNSTGCFIFQKLMEKMAPNDIVKAVREAFDIDDATARQDIEELYELTRTYGIL